MNVNSLLNPLRPTNQPPRWEVIYRPLDELRPHSANPRRHRKKQIRQIAESIKIFGFIVPILIDRYGNVIAGHGRLLAARELGMTEVPTLCLDHRPRPNSARFGFATTRLSEIATWDDRLLAEELKELSLLWLDSASRLPVLTWARSICGSCR